MNATLPPTTRRYTVTSRRGTTVIDTPLSDDQAIGTLRTLTNNTFAADLARQFSRGGLSPRQWAWTHVLAFEHRQQAQVVQQPVKAQPQTQEQALRNQVEAIVQDERQMDGVIALFQTAGGKLQKPRIRLATPSGRRYHLSLAGERSRYPGSISVVCERQGLIGRIMSDGLFIPVRDLSAHPELIDLLVKLAENPAEVARNYGRLTGRCCFCALELSDERSLSAGYGPICAGHYGLPWGAK